MYFILGCGDVGFTLAKKLRDKGEAIRILEKNPQKVNQLTELGFDTAEGDFTKPETLRDSGIEHAEVVLIMVSDSEVAERGLGAINQVKLDLEIDPIVIARSTDTLETTDMKEYGAAEVVASSEVLADFTHQKFQEFRERIKERQLRKVLKKIEGKMAIILQTNPDPDSISSGLALSLYASAFGVGSDMIYGGQIGHQQNRALVNALNLDLKKAKEVDFENYNAYALVDVSTRGNCALPEKIRPNIIIDHHSVVSEEIEAEHKDIVKVGATATLLANYLRYGEIEYDESFATALAFGILTDTLNFTRNASHLDFITFERLLPLISEDLLKELQSPPVSADTLEVIRKAIRSSRVKGGYLISNVGEVKDHDAIPQAADYLLRREGALTTLIYGIEGEKVYVSGRTKDVRLHIGKLMKDIYSKIGSAGGHPTAGGATIPLDAFDETKENMQALRGAMDRAIGRKFWETVGALKSER